MLATILAPTASAGVETLRPHAGQRVVTGKLDARLAELDYSATLRRGGATRAARSLSLATRDGSVRVVVEARDVRAARAAITKAGGTVSGSYGNLVSALVPPASLRSLAAVSAVKRVRTPAAAQTLSIAGEGVVWTGAGLAHAGGYTGVGVKVAVIDLGFAGLAAAVAAGDLPGATTNVDFCGGSFGTATSHGTGVAEVVHEQAPGAQLYLICVDDEVSLGLAETYAKANGIAIVNHSVGWFNTSRGDGSGAVGTPEAIAADARANGILWVNAAGNEADVHWSGTYSDVNGNGYNDFVGGDDLNGVSVGGLKTACVYLKWDSWPATSQNYDLHLYWADVLGTPAATSANLQSGTHAPTEGSCVTNTTLASRTLGVAIRRESTTASPRLDLFVTGDGLSAFEHQVAAGSLLEPAGSAQVLTVGGICWTSQALEPYSSQGPAIGGGAKPDLVAPDAVSGTTYGAFGVCTGERGFLGTSAASPHVAGAAAVLKQLNPSATPAQLTDSLLNAAQDLGVAGRDSLYGQGALWMPFAPSVSTGVADVDATSALVRGTVNGNGTATSSYVQWGKTTAYGSATTPVSIGATDSAFQAVSATIEELDPVTVYHYRVVGSSARGTTYGPDKVLTTRASASGVVGGAPDLELTVGAAPSGVAAGANLTYTMTVRNKGGGGATGLRILLTIPQASQHVSSTVSRGAGCSTTNAPRSLLCWLGSLGAGRTATVTLVVKALKAKELTLIATVGGDENELSMADNSVTHSLVASAAAASRSRLAVQQKLSVAGTGRGRVLTVPVSTPSRSSVRVVLWRGGEAIAFWRRSVAAGSRTLRLAVPRAVSRGRVTVELVVTSADGVSTTSKHAIVLPR